jgi:mannosyl-3-phosphoglycerate phosphatase
MDFPLLIFTDLDGTLLDHHSYSFQGAAEALQRLRSHAIPIILTSSKTRMELRKLQERLGLNEPFIAENGGGVFLPSNYTMIEITAFEQMGAYRAKLFGRPYSYIRKVFATLRPKYNIRGFGDMPVEELMTATGLDREDAILAQKRDFSEPFLFLKEPLVLKLQAEAAEHGLTVTRGGRFYHLMAAGQDKGRAATETTRLFQDQCHEKIVTVGLGDAENDYGMLKVVEIPVLIPKPDGSYENMTLRGLRRAPSPGSRGWGISVSAILDEFEQKQTGRAHGSA